MRESCPPPTMATTGRPVVGESRAAMVAEVSGAARTGLLGTVPTVAAASLRSTLRGTWRVLAKELSAFSVVGMSAFVVDLAAFQVLYAELGLGAVTAKLIASV